MKILILGDVVGRPGRNFLSAHLPDFRDRNAIDLVIANGENAAGGAGITAKTAKQLNHAKVDAITLGDHVWDQKNFENETEVSTNGTSTDPSKSIFEKFTEKIKTFLENAE